jgi:hypothetical protein
MGGVSPRQGCLLSNEGERMRRRRYRSKGLPCGEAGWRAKGSTESINEGLVRNLSRRISNWRRRDLLR